MAKSQKMNVWVTPQARQLASGLIRKMRIRQGNSLAPCLGLDPIYDNFSAIELWVQKMLVENKQPVNLDLLQQRVVGVVPGDMQGSLD